jgi:hypothetical protein
MRILTKAFQPGSDLPFIYYNKIPPLTFTDIPPGTKNIEFYIVDLSTKDILFNSVYHTNISTITNDNVVGKDINTKSNFPVYAYVIIAYDANHQILDVDAIIAKQRLYKAKAL